MVKCSKCKKDATNLVVIDNKVLTLCAIHYTDFSKIVF